MAASSSVFLQFRHVVKSGGLSGNLFTKLTHRMNNVCLQSTATSTVEHEKSSTKPTPKKMSKAMLAYLERARSHDAFIQQEKEDYQIGKRHLANMMGEDPEHFTQKDIDNAIEYLFPSGLYDKAARPLMKPPEVIFPPRKAAEFDETGRPFHSLFYTTKPNYYQALYDVCEHLEILNALEDEMIKKGIPPNPHNEFGLMSSDWLPYDRFQKLILEEIQETDYAYFISSIQRLADHPYAYNAKDFIMKYRIARKALTQSFIIPPLEHDSDGRPFITVQDCMRKTTRGTVTIRANGTGIITVNGKSLINYFPNMQEREQVR